MRNQVWSITILISIMCLVRFSIAAIGYTEPYWLMEQLGIPTESNIQMPYIIRVWAIRDVVLAVFVIFALQSVRISQSSEKEKNTLKTLLLACIIIDTTDIISAYLGGAAGLFSHEQTWSLQLTAIAALIPELIALILLTWPYPIIEGFLLRLKRVLDFWQ